MHYIIIEDLIYKITTFQMEQLEKVKDKDDETVLLAFIRENIQHYKLLGYISLQVRE